MNVGLDLAQKTHSPAGQAGRGLCCGQAGQRKYCGGAMRMMVFGWCVAAIVSGLAGAEQPAAKVVRFRRGAFILPHENSVDKALRPLCPLILQETPESDAENKFRRFGVLDHDAEGRQRVNTDQLTVYLVASEPADKSLRQLTFFWFYPAVKPGSPPTWRLCRTTLNEKGFPVAWEIRTDATDQRVFYVAKSLEQTAAKRGPPLAGRRFSVEPSREQHPDVTVARIVGEAPQPLGPVVYLDHASLAVTDMRCRCEPAQVAEFAVTTHYRLVRLKDVEAVEELSVPEQLQTLLTRPARLEDVLR